MRTLKNFTVNLDIIAENDDDSDMTPYANVDVKLTNGLTAQELDLLTRRLIGVVHDTIREELKTKGIKLAQVCT